MPVGKEQNANELSSGIVWQAIGGLVVLGLISLAFWVVQSDSHRRESVLQTNPKPPSLSEQGESRAGVSPKTRFHPPSDVGFIGGHACAECHLEICESYSAHPMANSLRRIHATTEPGNMSREESRFGNGRSRYEIECLGNTMRHHELTVDSSSEVLFDEAVDIVRRQGRASVSMLQRKLRIGYTRASRLVDAMEDEGIVGPPTGGTGVRDVLDYGKAAPPAAG